MSYIPFVRSVTWNNAMRTFEKTIFPKFLHKKNQYFFSLYHWGCDESEFSLFYNILARRHLQHQIHSHSTRINKNIALSTRTLTNNKQIRNKTLVLLVSFVYLATKNMVFKALLSLFWINFKMNTLLSNLFAICLCGWNSSDFLSKIHIKK